MIKNKTATITLEEYENVKQAILNLSRHNQYKDNTLDGLYEIKEKLTDHQKLMVGCVEDRIRKLNELIDKDLQLIREFEKKCFGGTEEQLFLTEKEYDDLMKEWQMPNDDTHEIRKMFFQDEKTKKSGEIK